VAQLFKTKSPREGVLFLNDEMLIRLRIKQGVRVGQTHWVDCAIWMPEKPSKGQAEDKSKKSEPAVHEQVLCRRASSYGMTFSKCVFCGGVYAGEPFPRPDETPNPVIDVLSSAEQQQSPVTSCAGLIQLLVGSYGSEIEQLVG